MSELRRFQSVDDFIDSMGGSRQDLIDLALSCDLLLEFCLKLPYKVDTDDMPVKKFYRDVAFNYEVFVDSLDDELREQLHSELAPCTKKVFLDRACAEDSAYKEYAEDLGLI